MPDIKHLDLKSFKKIQKNETSRSTTKKPKPNRKENQLKISPSFITKRNSITKSYLAVKEQDGFKHRKNRRI